MSGAADICDLPGGVEDIEDIVGADDVTPRDRYQNKPVPVPRVRKRHNKSPVSFLLGGVGFDDDDLGPAAEDQT